MKVSWPVALVVVLVLVLLLAPSRAPAAPSSTVDTSFDQAVRQSAAQLQATVPKSGGGSASPVSQCHQAVEGGSGAVLGKYGVPGNVAAQGAKLNPFYWYCDAGGAIEKGAQAVGHFFGSLF